MSEETVILPASYVNKLAMCLKGHGKNLPKQINATKNYLNQVGDELLTALENVRAGKSNYFPDEVPGSINVDWCDTALAFAVQQDGKTVKTFPTRVEAEGFAKSLMQGAANGTKAAAGA